MSSLVEIRETKFCTHLICGGHESQLTRRLIAPAQLALIANSAYTWINASQLPKSKMETIVRYRQMSLRGGTAPVKPVLSGEITQ